MDTQGVLTRFITLANIPSAQSLMWQELAADCAADIASRIDSAYDTAQNSRVLEAAAAALALYRYRVSLCTDIDNTGQSESDPTTDPESDPQTDPETAPDTASDTNIVPSRELSSFKVGDITLEFSSSSSSSGSSSSGSGSSSGKSSGSSSAASSGTKFGSGVSEAYEMYKQALEACEQWFKKTTISSEFVFGRMESLCTES